MNPEDVEALLDREPRPEPPASVEVALRRALERGRRPVSFPFRRFAMVAASLSLFAVVLASVLMGGPPGAPAQEKKPAVDVRLEVTNYYKSADGTMFSSGSWDFSCAEGAAKGKAAFSLKGDTKREGTGEITREQAAALMASLKKDGVLTAQEAQPCKCDAPVFTVRVVDGEAKNSFALRHAHDDHDGAQRRLIESIIAAVEKIAAPRPAVAIKLEVSNYYTDGAGTMWSSGVWEIEAKEGAEASSVRVALEPQKGGRRREAKGMMTRADVAALLASLRKSGAFEAKDPTPCLCDAPVFMMTAREGAAKNAFKLAHNHGERKDPQVAMIEAVIEAVEKRAKE
jgi:uncharacterized lipoprotein YmbA